MFKKENLEAAAQSMNLLIVIDTEYVKANYPSPSQDQNNPTGIDHNSQFMICTGTRGVISGQGTADLSFKANPGDYLSVYGQSIYANSDDAVIVYDLKYWNGDQVFNNFQVDTVSRTNVVFPQTGTANGLPAVTGPASFISLDSRVSKQGTENFYVCFALYTLAADGETQQLYGYYYWDPTITVS
ncbi:inclusion body family protein [Flavobacterium coralii]|uniref:inclusion body family protein n=1 Tax=Flavobacterium coralii TaxID=2838017 RepID=UPI000C4B1CAF|nr:inclusion body family protein [Flavobacterium coralii]MBE99885.1 DNA-directed RNA polymerase subunit beta [Flavobacterium sp.]MBY8963921.1 DNA-directed RNA polymerase subunit beta [Flavobacterium coralii]|tara:strand:- start:54131 stop:54685 length:555 start_codon:yes stop_codon:yes gene_type:complete